MVTGEPPVRLRERSGRDLLQTLRLPRGHRRRHHHLRWCLTLTLTLTLTPTLTLTLTLTLCQVEEHRTDGCKEIRFADGTSKVSSRVAYLFTYV